LSSLGKSATSGKRSQARTVPAGRSARAEPEAATAAAARPTEAKAVQPGPVPRMLNIGYGNLVIASRIVAIVSPQSSPMRRLREEASERGKLVDATHGRRTRSILVTDSDHVILSAINPETIATRITPDEPVGGT
jgi:regulator of extracellular matrix RemA (YlzA/DUF370 family)